MDGSAKGKNSCYSRKMRRLFIYGFPGLYGGAGTELHHQFFIWSQLNIKLHVIPNWNPINEPLYDFVKSIATIEQPNDFSNVTQDDAVISFCSKFFLDTIDSIYEKTKKTIFVNCMTWLFEKEIEAHKRKKISFSLYQRFGVQRHHQISLRPTGTKCEFMTFVPYFHADNHKFTFHDEDISYLGRISRSDADKFSSHAMHIWEYIVSPKRKVGLILGWKPEIEKKIGKIPSWVRTYTNHNEYPVNTFYNTANIIVQSTDTNENLPRIGFEAMHSGCPLVVDNRGGWKYMIDHKKNGFLCNNEREFIYYGSKLLFEPNLRFDIAQAAKEKAIMLSGFDISKESWEQIFEKIFK